MQFYTKCDVLKVFLCSSKEKSVQFQEKKKFRKTFSQKKQTKFKCVNEEKVTVAGCSTGSKEFLRRKVDKNVANKKHRNTPFK